MISQPSSSTILVTGASGFLGRAITGQLLATACQLKTSGRRLPPPPGLPNYSAAELLDSAAVSRLTEGVDIIVHAAGLAHQLHSSQPESADYFRTNLAGTANLIHAAAANGCQRFVYVSSVSVYGTGWPVKTEESICLPKNAYARSKLEGEQIAAEIATSVGMELIILRMATLYGENDPGNVGRLMRLIDRRRFIWIGRGENQKSLIHVEDAARACVIAASYRNLPHRSVYNVSADPCTMRTIVSTLVENLHRRVPSLYVPPPLPVMATAVAAKIPGVSSRAARFKTEIQKWLSDEVYDGALFQNSFNWGPKISLREGLARTVALYRHIGKDSATAFCYRPG